MMQKITDRVYMLPHDDCGDRPALGYIRGDRYALMVDAGNSAEHVRLYKASLAALALPMPDFVALTHWHWDHTFGLHAVGCPAIASVQTNAYIGDMMAWAWTDEAMARRLETGEDNDFCDEMIREVYPDRSRIIIRQADIAFANALTVDLGGVTCELRHFENPHSADGVLLYVPEERVLFLGDANYEGHHHGREPLYREKLAELIVSLETLPFEVCIGGHEEPLSRAALLQALRDELKG